MGNDQSMGGGSPPFNEDASPSAPIPSRASTSAPEEASFSWAEVQDQLEKVGNDVSKFFSQEDQRPTVSQSHDIFGEWSTSDDTVAQSYVRFEGPDPRMCMLMSVVSTFTGFEGGFRGKVEGRGFFHGNFYVKNTNCIRITIDPENVRVTHWPENMTCNCFMWWWQNAGHGLDLKLEYRSMTEIVVTPVTDGNGVVDELNQKGMHMPSWVFHQEQEGVQLGRFGAGSSSSSQDSMLTYTTCQRSIKFETRPNFVSFSHAFWELLCV